MVGWAYKILKKSTFSYIWFYGRELLGQKCIPYTTLLVLSVLLGYHISVKVYSSACYGSPQCGYYQGSNWLAVLRAEKRGYQGILGKSTYLHNMYLIFIWKLDWFVMKMQCIKYFHSTPWEILQILIGEPFLWAKWFLRYPPPPILISHWFCTELNDHLHQSDQGRNSAHGRKFWTPAHLMHLFTSIMSTN